MLGSAKIEMITLPLWVGCDVAGRGSLVPGQYRLNDDIEPKGSLLQYFLVSDLAENRIRQHLSIFDNGLSVFETVFVAYCNIVEL